MLLVIAQKEVSILKCVCQSAGGCMPVCVGGRVITCRILAAEHETGGGGLGLPVQGFWCWGAFGAAVGPQGCARSVGEGESFLHLQRHYSGSKPDC